MDRNPHTVSLNYQSASQRSSAVDLEFCDGSDRSLDNRGSRSYFREWQKQVRYPCRDRALMDEIRSIWVNFEREADSPNC